MAHDLLSPQLDFAHKPLTVKSPPDFTVISTFSGCGGSSTGYVWAGGKVLLAVEWDNNAVDCYRANYPDTPVYHGDIAKLSVDDVLERTGLQVGELDIFDGSPPCQGFSTAGKRQLDDDRNQLFREYTRLLSGLKPKVFVMENVSGMVKGAMKPLFVEILTELKACGYRVSARLLNAAYLGVPQSRERIIFVGVRDDLGIEPVHPKPQTKPIPFRVAVRGVPEPLEPHREIKQDWLKAYVRVHPQGKWTTNRRLYESIKGNSASAQSLLFASWEKHIGTIVKSEIHVIGIVHPNRHRYLSVPELMRCSSFPDHYVLLGKRKDRVARLGNSVPPRMMQYIAECIKRDILRKVKT